MQMLLGAMLIGAPHSALECAKVAFNRIGRDDRFAFAAHVEASKGFHFAMAKKPSQEIEFHPDAMQRFGRGVKVVAKTPPQHRVAKKAAKKTKAKKKPGK
jgi:hypothetical protein